MRMTKFQSNIILNKIQLINYNLLYTNHSGFAIKINEKEPEEEDSLSCYFL